MNGHDGLVNLKIGRTTAEALDVDTPPLRVDMECGQSALLAKQLDFVNVLVSAIITCARVALGVLVGHGRAECVENGTGGDVL